MQVSASQLTLQTLVTKKNIKTISRSKITLSLSLINIRKVEISEYMIGSIFPGRSTIEYFIAIATVALVFAAGLDVRSYENI
jgi:hypothetical protein